MNDPAHRHANCKHPCHCAGPKSFQCQKCARMRSLAKAAVLYRQGGQS